MLIKGDRQSVENYARMVLTAYPCDAKPVGEEAIDLKTYALIEGVGVLAKTPSGIVREFKIEADREAIERASRSVPAFGFQ